jgi:hypothetical protein
MKRLTTDQTSRWDVSGLRHQVTDRLQECVINPLDKLAFALRIPPPGDAPGDDWPTYGTAAGDAGVRWPRG